jgi:hypothetical protein
VAAQSGQSIGIAGEVSGEAHAGEPHRLLLAVSRIVNRDQLFAALCILACVNGLATTVRSMVDMFGGLTATLLTFNVSAFAWIACALGPWLLIHNERSEEPTAADTVVALIVAALALVPFGRLSWLGLTALSLYILYNSQANSGRRRGALILLALTGPMLWGPLLMTVFAQPIVLADAVIVAKLIGAHRIGNVINFLDAPGGFQVGPACSSLHGVSVAFLAWMMITQTVRRTSSLDGFGWAVLAALSVIAVNDVRLGLLGRFPGYFETIHGPVGGAVASWLSVALIVSICLFGVRREIFAPR